MISITRTLIEHNFHRAMFNGCEMAAIRFIRVTGCVGMLSTCEGVSTANRVFLKINIHLFVRFNFDKKSIVLSTPTCSLR